VKTKSNYKRLEYWIEKHQSNGRLSFSLNEIRQSFRNDSETALKQMLERLSVNSKIVSVLKGFYVIVPPAYSSKGILPPAMFIDGLMKFLQRNYYVGLLNAAALHGASHQQPQEYFVLTGYPALRTTNKKGVKINYISTRLFPPGGLLEKRKTEAGYINVSNPILTALDLVTYEKKIGGLSRASSVIHELVEAVKLKDISNDFVLHARVTSMQRLGYIFEEILERRDLADKIQNRCKKNGIAFYMIPLKASGSKQCNTINEKWKLKINTGIEIDE